MKKRLLAALLSLAMCVSLLPVAAFATGDSTINTLDALNTAINNATKTEPTTITLAAGTYELFSTLKCNVHTGDGNYCLDANGKTITIKGTDAATTIIDMTGIGSHIYHHQFVMQDATFTFENVTIKFPESSHKGLQYATKIVYNNCTFSGTQTLYAPHVEFNNCKFEGNGNKDIYYVWTYGIADAIFNGCTFTTGGKAILCYHEAKDASLVANVTLTNCTFNDDGSLNTTKAAVETGSDGGNTETSNKYRLTFTNCTVNGFDVNNSPSALWGNKNSMDADHLIVSVSTGVTWDDNEKLTGGTFTEKPDEGDVAPGYTVTDNGDGTWTVTPPAPPPSSSGGSSRPSYPITVPEVENGTVVTSSERAKSGRTVTVTVTPDEGYALDTLTVLDRNGDPVELTQKEDGTYTFKMPAGKVDIQASFVALKLPFVDVSESDWFYDSVWYAYFHGLMTGTAADRFSPYLTTTRGMIATILHRLESEPSVSGLETPFTDLTQDWYRDAVIWAAAHDIVLGYGDGTYGPEDPITREQLVTILYRFVDTPLGSADLSAFVDSDQTSPYAAYPMSWAVSIGLLQGDDQHRLNPGNPATRAEMAAILTRFCEAMAL